MRMEAPTKKSPPREGLKLQPPEEDEVLGLTKFLIDVYEGHVEQQYGMHVGPEEEWRGYVGGLFKGDSGQFMPDASYVALEGDRIVGAILVTHWMGTPLVAELGVAKDRRGRGMGRALLEAAMGRLASRDEPRLALYVTLGNDSAIALYRSLGFVQVGGQSVTARLESSVRLAAFASGGSPSLSQAVGKLIVWPSAWRRVFAGARMRNPFSRAKRSMIPRTYRPPRRAVTTMSAFIGAGSAVSRHRSWSTSLRMWRQARYATL